MGPSEPLLGVDLNACDVGSPKFGAFWVVLVIINKLYTSYTWLYTWLLLDVLIIHCWITDTCYHSLDGQPNPNLTLLKFGVFVKDDICQRLAKSEHNLTHLPEAHATQVPLKCAKISEWWVVKLCWKLQVGHDCWGWTKHTRPKGSSHVVQNVSIVSNWVKSRANSKFRFRCTYSWRCANMLRLPNLLLSST